MHLVYSKNRIDALMGDRLPKGSDEATVARYVIERMLDGGEAKIAPSVLDWIAGIEIGIHADKAFLEREEINRDEVDWQAVKAAVTEALRMLTLPKGITLIESNSWAVWACGKDLDDAKADFERQLGPHAFEETTSRSQDRFMVVRGPMPEGGWEASDGDRVLMMGTLEGHLLAHALVSEAA